VAPVIRADLVAKHPQVAAVVNSVSARLTTEAMRAMNAAAVQDKKPPDQVAKAFLIQAGLVKKGG
jgi:osmoprotectant transport system substrate-binding protein